MSRADPFRPDHPAAEEARTAVEAAPREDEAQGRPSLREATALWFKIGCCSFGGPAAQIALMHRLVVDEKKWVDEARFLHALNLCMLLPGPEAQQLATYLGWLTHRARGGLIAGGLFVLPGAIVMMALSLIYALYNEIPLIEGLFYGISCAVLAIVVEAILRIGKRALKHPALYAIAAIAFVAIFFFAVPFPLIVFTAAIVGAIGAAIAPKVFAPSTNAPDAGAKPEAPPFNHLGHLARTAAVGLALWFGPVLALAAALGWSSTFTDIGLFFSKMAIVTFGGAYAVLAYVAQQAVETYGWLGPDEMLTGLGLAETTPGPLIMVVQYVGFLGAFRAPAPFDPVFAGVLGGALATWVTFAPSFLWIFLGAPYVERLRGVRRLTGALAGITAAVVGVILNLAVWFALHVVFRRIDETEWGWLRLHQPELASLDAFALVLAATSMTAMLYFDVGLARTLAACAVAGAAWRLLT